MRTMRSNEGSEGAIEKGIRGREGERGEGEERCGHNISSYPFASFKDLVSVNYLNSPVKKQNSV
jgi:hypothetical protein